MSYADRLIDEINTELDHRAESREAWVPRWITHAICERHRSALVSDHPDSAFWEHAGYTLTRKLVTECINKRAEGLSDGRQRLQLDLPGFDRKELQDYYVVVREQEEIAVCVLALTDAEIDAKVQLYKKQAQTSMRHAKELERFKEWRQHQRQAHAS